MQKVELKGAQHFRTWVPPLFDLRIPVNLLDQGFRKALGVLSESSGSLVVEYSFASLAERFVKKLRISAGNAFHRRHPDNPLRPWYMGIPTLDPACARKGNPSKN